MRLGAPAALAALMLLAGCAQVPAPINPVSWWHGLEGGAIAKNRPPPPGANAPYPNLGTIPPSPAPTSVAAQSALAAKLAADRAQGDLLHVETQTAAIPPLPARAPAPAGGGMSASIAAVPAKPAPAATSSQTAGPPASQGAAPSDSALPALPTAAPAAPRIAGLAFPAAPPPAARPAIGGKAVTVPFRPGSWQLSRTARERLVALARGRGSATIRVRAGGEAPSAAPTAQSAALALALDRVRVMTDVLIAAGVPPGAVSWRAEAAGREAVAYKR